MAKILNGEQSGGDLQKLPSTRHDDEEMEMISELYEKRPEMFEKWLRERAPPDAIHRIHAIVTKSPKSPRKGGSVSSDLFQQWLALSPVRVSSTQEVTKSQILRLHCLPFILTKISSANPLLMQTH